MRCTLRTPDTQTVAVAFHTQCCVQSTDQPVYLLCTPDGNEGQSTLPATDMPAAHQGVWIVSVCTPLPPMHDAYSARCIPLLNTCCSYCVIDYTYRIHCMFNHAALALPAANAEAPVQYVYCIH
jgi:hypothetical protein